MVDLLAIEDSFWRLDFWLIIAAVLLGLFLLLVCVAMIEKHPPNEYVKVPAGEAVTQSPYALAMAEQAFRLGYSGGELARHVKANKYASAWFSSDRVNLLLIASGKLAGTTHRRTVLMSRLPNGQFLMTTDDVGDVDTTGIQNQKVLLYADLYELHEHHRERLAKHLPSPEARVAFAEPSPIEAYAGFQRAETDLLIQRGQARYLDDTQTYWRLRTPTAIRAIAKAVNPIAMFKNARGSQARVNRPGDPKYKPRIKDAIPTARPIVADDVVAAIVEEQPNIAWDASPVTFELRSRYVAVFDPLMLDVFRDEEVSRDADAEILAAAAQRLAAREPAFACIPIIPFTPGPHAFDPDQLQPLDGSSPDGVDAVAVDSGSLIIADVAALPRMAGLMDWDVYEQLLGPNSEQVIERLMEQLGGPVFALVHGDAERRFAGDGTYRVPAACVQSV